MTDLEKQRLAIWLQSPDAIRVVLVEVSNVGLVGGGNTSYYFSSLPYTSQTINYDPVIIGGVSFNEQISLDGSASVGFGDIELENTNGERDSWINEYWNKRNINIYIGDVRWNKAAPLANQEFFQIFGGLVDSIGMRDRNVINLVLVDKLQRLNEPIQHRKLKDITTNVFIPGTTTMEEGSPLYTNKDKVAPLLLGESFNIEGIPCQPSNPNTTLIYSINDGQVFSIIEVRDNGVPIGFTPDLTHGTFTLTQAGYGQITATVQGETYPELADGAMLLTGIARIGNRGVHSPLSLAKQIVTNLGDLSSRFNWATEVDTDSYDEVGELSFGTYNSITYTHYDIRCGIYCTGGENKLDVIQKLLGSASIHIVVSQEGKLKFIKFQLPQNNSLGTLTEISDSDFEFASSSITEISVPVGTIKLGYDKNYTLQDSTLAGSVPITHKQLYKEDFVTAEDSIAYATSNEYNVSTAPPELQETTFIDTPFAAIEAKNRLGIWQVPRKVISFTGYAHLMSLELGEHIHLKTNRFGLENGKNGTVISIDKSWLTGRVTIGVLV